MFRFGKTSNDWKVVKPAKKPAANVGLDTPDESPMKTDDVTFSDTLSPGVRWGNKEGGNGGNKITGTRVIKNLNSEIEREGDVELGGESPTEHTSLLKQSSNNNTPTVSRDWVSFAVICLVILIGDTARGVMFPTLYRLNMSLGGSKVTQGYCVASFSFGRVLMSPYLGKMSETYGYRTTLRLSLSLLITGTLMYAAAGTPYLTGPLDGLFGTTRAGLALLVSAQIVMGLGSGTLGVTRAYVAESTGREERTKWLSYLTAVQYTGFTVMPVVGGFFCGLVKPSGVIPGGWRLGALDLNEFTLPGYFMTAMASLSLALLLTVFKDKKRAEKKKAKVVERVSDDYASEKAGFGEFSRFDVAVLGCLMLNVATKGSIAVYETLSVPFATSHFSSYDSQRAGFAVSSAGALGVLALLCMGLLGRCMTDTQMIVYGALTMVAGTGSLVHFGDHKNFPPSRFEAAIFLLYSVGYPIGHTAVIGLFSKIVGGRPQGALLGWFASAGSLARMGFPILAGYASSYLGSSVVFMALIAVLGTAAVGVQYFTKELARLSTE